MDLDSRFWEVDLLRGVAVSTMIAYHLLYDLNFFHATSIDLSTLPWLLLGRGTASVFVFLVGVSLSLSYARAGIRDKTLNKTRKYLHRGIRILSYGFFISFVTWFFLGDDMVVFGILHLIGLSIILSIPLLDKSPRLLFSAGILLVSLFFLLGFFIPAGGFWLIWLGFPPQGFSSVDYAPLLPWFGLVLLGLGSGKFFYGGYKRRHAFPDYSSFPPVSLICSIGRHSLFIYFIHQPILLTLMYLAGWGDVNTIFSQLGL